MSGSPPVARPASAPRPGGPRRTLVRGVLRAGLLAGLLPLGSCAWWFFSGLPEVDRSRPVALVETTGGVEYGATTELGILTLGRSAQGGPCRVHYFLGPTPMIEHGAIEPTGSTFYRARIDLRTQNLRVLDRPVQPGDMLLAMWTPDGVQVEEVPVALATGPGIGGDLLADPGRHLPPGAAVLAQGDGGLLFAGLVSARAVLDLPAGDGPGGRQVYYSFAGVDRVRELLAVPEVHPQDYRVRYRPDGITVREPIR